VESELCVAIKDAWNSQADEYNQWDAMSVDEQVEFAYKLGIEKTAVHACNTTNDSIQCTQKEVDMQQIMIRMSDDEKTALDQAVADAGAMAGKPISQASWVRNAIKIQAETEQEKKARK
jgi:hypothetical protein